MSSIVISTAIFCLLGVTGMGVYVALYGSHRVFQERFAEMVAHLQITEGAVFDQDREPEGSVAPSSTGPWSGCLSRRFRRHRIRPRRRW